MVAHSPRTLVKNGHQAALGVLGLTTEALVTGERFHVYLLVSVTLSRTCRVCLAASEIDVDQRRASSGMG